MNRRRCMFWLGYGLFGLSETLRADFLDGVAAAAMRATTKETLPAPAPPTHWRAAQNSSWRWYERETYAKGQWKVTGITTPVHRESGKLAEGSGYLDESLVPTHLRDLARHETDDSEAAEPNKDFSQHRPSPERRSRHGRPPSKWLRSLQADELRIWLKTIEVPEAGVEGMTYFEHLTRDHSFAAKHVTDLTSDEQAKLHAAAHYGY